MNFGRVVGDGGITSVGWWWVVLFGIDSLNVVEVVVTDQDQYFGLTEAGVSCSPIVTVGIMLGYFIIILAGGWVVGGFLPTRNGHDFFPTSENYLRLIGKLFIKYPMGFQAPRFKF